MQKTSACGSGKRRFGDSRPLATQRFCFAMRQAV